MTSTKRPKTVCAMGAELGEGPVWDVPEQVLWFVDIKGPKIHRFDPSTEGVRSWDSPEPVGWVLPATGGAMIAGLKSGLHRFDPTTGAFDLVASVEADQPQNRLNDASTDPGGRIWFGTMDDTEREASGQYYVFDRGKVSAAGLAPVKITNGPALSPDGRILYHVDTAGQVIYATQVAENASLGATREFVRFAKDEGFPDGPTVDSEGCLWIALFFGWEARRYSPAGALLERIRFPVSNVTKLAFGGPDLRTVYATTARLDLKSEDMIRQPEAGNLFAFRADVPGLATTPAALR